MLEATSLQLYRLAKLDCAALCLAAVGEAFATWDVDVTTEDPGFEGLERCAAEADLRLSV